MNVISLQIPEVKVIRPKVFGDERGYFVETYRETVLHEAGINDHFVQDNLSYSRKGILRGLHYQIEQAQAKLVKVVHGKVLDVALDIRLGSPTYGKHVSYILEGNKGESIYIPKGFAHGFQVLSDEVWFEYKCSDYYYPAGERGILYSDPSLEIQWEEIEPVLSEKDLNNPVLSQVSEKDLFNYE
jgi:dTDP-4-dehydrorhamnose 3,5-epimerase